MSEVKTNLKTMPPFTTKAGLVNMYLNQMPEGAIIKEINTIIVATRRLEPGRTPRYSKVYHIELREFVEIYGVPIGYETPEWYKP